MTAISTQRLNLRPLTKASQRQVDWLRDPDVVRFSEQRHRDHTLSSQLRYINSFGGRSRIWGIYLIETGAHIGNITATHDAPNNIADVGILIGEKKLWGKGLAGEAWRGACNWLLDKDCGAVRKLEAGCARTNEAMLKIIRGSGFTEEGERKLCFVMEGGPVSAVLFGRFN